VIKRALISVSDKSGLDDLARALTDLGVEILSTGGTAQAISGMGIAVTTVESVTGQKEILGGRVKTLHPLIHGAILGRGDHEGDAAEMAEAGIEPIDLVVITLYPFEDTVARRGVTDAEAIEKIDIGGPAMIRAAAKNHARVGVVTSPGQYADVIDELRADGALSDATRRRLAAAAFQRTASYDAAIATWMTQAESDFPDVLVGSYDKVLELSYGENPHQRGAYYAKRGARTHLLSRVEQLHGKAISYNNLLDLDSARALNAEFQLPACVIVKHNNPCGVAVAADVGAAYERALASDPVSAYGGVIVVNRTVDLALGEMLAATFVEILLAPAYDDDALEVLTRKPNTRILVNTERRRSNPGEQDIRRVLGGVLIQDRDSETEERDTMQVGTSLTPTEAQWGDLLFAWRVGKHVKSNAIVIARDLATIGIGAGQMSRVDSVRLAVEKAGGDVTGGSLASDAFFPFADGPEAAIDAGVRAIVQPGGSIRDDEVLAACDERGVTMILTGRRHFRH
jgi:phosphoribosylaminoimidazolecarboxamide formyltransferase / IMP cyclohydrolase